MTFFADTTYNSQSFLCFVFLLNIQHKNLIEVIFTLSKWFFSHDDSIGIHIIMFIAIHIDHTGSYKWTEQHIEYGVKQFGIYVVRYSTYFLYCFYSFHNTPTWKLKLFTIYADNWQSKIFYEKSIFSNLFFKTNIFRHFRLSIRIVKKNRFYPPCYPLNLQTPHLS